MRRGFSNAAAVMISAALASGASFGPAMAQEEAMSPRDPSSWISILADMQARAELHSRDAGAVRLDVITPGGIFGAEFLGCGEQGRECRAARFTATLGERPVSDEELNTFNDQEVLCRAVRHEGKIDVRYGLLISDQYLPADMKAHVGVWQGCLTAVGQLVTRPD